MGKSNRNGFEITGISRITKFVLPGFNCNLFAIAVLCAGQIVTRGWLEVQGSF